MSINFDIKPKYKVGDHIKAAGGYTDTAWVWYGVIFEVNEYSHYYRAYEDDTGKAAMLYESEIVELLQPLNRSAKTGLKVGDKVRLTGYEWCSMGVEGDDWTGAVVEVDGFDDDGEPTFSKDGETWSITNDAEWGGELVDPEKVIENDNIDYPSHYTAYKGIEVIQLTEQLNFNRGNAVKYIARAGLKNPDTELEDLKKAAWYINREIARIENAI